MFLEEKKLIYLARISKALPRDWSWNWKHSARNMAKILCLNIPITLSEGFISPYDQFWERSPKGKLVINTIRNSELEISNVFCVSHLNPTFVPWDKIAAKSKSPPLPSYSPAASSTFLKQTKLLETMHPTILNFWIYEGVNSK